MAEKKNKPIYVTKSFLPPRAEFDALVDEIWESDYLTNNGPLSKRFVQSVTHYLGIDNDRFTFVSNGTSALQLALHHFIGDLPDAEIITTPFSYVATTSAILWEKYKPVYVDIKSDNFTIDPSKIEAAITEKTKAILAVHVFGCPCDIEAIEAIAKKHNLKVIYDAAHAFGVSYKGRSILEYGDASTLSFHATKLMHTIEGGGIYVKSHKDNQSIELSKRFGHEQDDHTMLGINAKASEFQAAMGLANLKHIDGVISKRKETVELYDRLLSATYQTLKIADDVKYNYGYYPILFKSEKDLKNAFKRLADANIFPRRYFYPSLNTLVYVKGNSCPVSEDISSRIACLPLDAQISREDVKMIAGILTQ